VVGLFSVFRRMGQFRDINLSILMQSPEKDKNL